MGRKQYSGWQDLPSGLASGHVTEGCLVLEGGAFRGIYVEGVADALMKHGINLSATVGCSAGALNGMSYTSGQIGRSARINLGHRHDRDYVGLRPLLREGCLVSLRYLFEEMAARYPLDYKRLNAPSRRFAVCVTNCKTGEAAFPDTRSTSSIDRAVMASASMPFVSRMVKVDGVPCLDGGCSCKVPYRWALEQGYEKIVVVRTQHRDYRKKPFSGALARLARLRYHRYPGFVKSLTESNDDYNRQCEELEALEREGRVLLLSPSVPVTVGRLEGDMEKLGQLYWLGYRDTGARLDQIRAYLQI